MNRKLEIVDILVAIGMVATLFGGSLLFMVSYGGAWGIFTSTQSGNPPTKLMVESMLQPALGQAMVDHATLEQQFAADVSRGATKLYRAALAAEHKPVGGLDTIKSQAAQFRANHAAQVQYMMGKTIVNLTGQGVRAGVLSGDNLSNTFNDRIIATAKTIGDVEEQFNRNWQSRLGQWIVAAALREHRFAGHVQERIGKETVKLATIQHDYLTNRAGIRNQLATLTTAAARSKAENNRFAQLGRGDVSGQSTLGSSGISEMGVSKTRTFQEIPIRYMVVAFAGLIVIFLMGFSFPSGCREPENIVNRLEKLQKEIFLKAV